MRRYLFFTALLLLFGLLGEAQGQFVQGTTITVEADHDGLNTTEYHLLENGTVKGNLPVSALANNIIRFPYVVPARGIWVITVEACNEDGCTVSDPANLNSGKPRPNKPGKPRFLSILTSLFNRQDTVASLKLQFS